MENFSKEYLEEIKKIARNHKRKVTKDDALFIASDLLPIIWTLARNLDDYQMRQQKRQEKP